MLNDVFWFTAVIGPLGAAALLGAALVPWRPASSPERRGLRPAG